MAMLWLTWRGGLEWMGWGRGKGILLFTDHIKQSPPVPPFLHASLVPSPSASHSALPFQLHPDMLTHPTQAQMCSNTEPQCGQHTFRHRHIRAHGLLVSWTHPCEWFVKNWSSFKREDEMWGRCGKRTWKGCGEIKKKSCASFMTIPVYYICACLWRVITYCSSIQGCCSG